MPEIIVYWRPFCGYCQVLKSRLQERGIPYHAIDIWEQRDQAEIVKQANDGDELVPTVQVGGRFLPNPSIDEVVDALESAA